MAASVLTNVGSTYDAVGASKGLGMGIVDFTGVTQVLFAVHVNKVGTGTQSWQLWVTDQDGSNGAQLGVIDDAGAAGDKILNAAVDVTGLGLTGVKLVRVRAKSTVAADDPVIYNAAMLAR